ncbi:MAG: hypothetical protein FIA99_13965 [Ruminiclostridium sp.]|nr:hypothetical protein [Ruminiclostridium sp.]
MLRKLRLPIQDIQGIFISNELFYAVSALQRHLQETRHEAEELKALSTVLAKLIETIRAQDNLSEMFKSIDVPVNSAILELKNALKITLSERNSSMSENSSYNKIGDVRIVSLPRMVFACYRAEGPTPENDCSKVVNKLILENALHRKYGFRHFGFNNPDPKEGTPVYGYEMWVVIPEDFDLPEQFSRKEFSVGLFASIPARLSNIGERWKQLWEWVMNNEKYEVDWNPETDRRWLEECINYETFNSSEAGEEDLQLDLLAPIKIK